MKTDRPIPVIILAGPTGAGKTAAALALADNFPVTVINADSRQVYRDFPIITAQPTPEEQAHCPHLLYGFLPTDASIHAGAYIRLSAPLIAKVHSEGRLPLLVGGTGLYLKTLLHGVASIPAIDQAVKDLWQQKSAENSLHTLHAILKNVDPQYAAKIHPNDRQRIIRALEVWQQTGNPLSWWHAQPLPPSPYQPLYIGIKRSLAELEPLLLKRIDLMLKAGAIEEAQSALKVCDNPTSPGWSGIGCQELFLHLREGLPLQECRSLWLKNTRAYAKRQLTWFNGSTNMNWFAPEQTCDIVATVTATFPDLKKI